MKPNELFRHLFIITATCYLIYFVQRGISKVFSQDVSVVVSSEPMSKNYTLPYVTICPRFHNSDPVGFGDSIIRGTTFKKAIKNGKGLRDVSLVVEPHQIAKQYQFHQLGRLSESVMFEPCYTYLQKFENGKTWIDFSMTDVIDVYLIFHRRLGMAYSFFNMNGNERPYFTANEMRNGKLLSRFVELELEVTIKQRRHHMDNCEADETLIDEACLERYLEHKLQCKLPWSAPATGNNYFVCSTEDQFRALASEMMNTTSLNPSQIREFFTKVGCKVPCDYEEFKHRVVLDDTRIEDPSISTTFLTGNMFLRNEDIKVETEVIMYDVITLIGDFGGMIGLLLGYSLITIFDFGLYLEKIIKQQLIKL